jgi:uncharacterized protein YaeQ
MMVRLLAFAIHANEALTFTKGCSTWKNRTCGTRI